MNASPPRAPAWIPVGGPAPERGVPAPAPPQWVPEAAEGRQPLVVRPSLRAAADLPLRVFGSVLGLLIPFAVFVGVDAALEGRTIEPVALAAAALATPELLIALLAPFAPAVRIAFTRYVFADDGVYVRTQILSKNEQRVAWGKVTALRHSRTFMDRLLGIERIDVVAYGMRGTTVRLVGLKDAPRIRDLISVRMRRTATARSLFEND